MPLINVLRQLLSRKSNKCTTCQQATKHSKFRYKTHGWSTSHIRFYIISITVQQITHVRQPIAFGSSIVCQDGFPIACANYHTIFVPKDPSWKVNIDVFSRTENIIWSPRILENWLDGQFGKQRVIEILLGNWVFWSRHCLLGTWGTFLFLKTATSSMQLPNGSLIFFGKRLISSVIADFQRYF